jgi:uncharacterized protein (TIGR02453 family)
MNLQIILDFLRELKENNYREWFNANKNRFLEAKSIFEDLTTKLILKISEFDEDVKYLTPSECIFRIYRDVRFSPDKSPYKTHFGAYIAAGGGRKSSLAGYYVHIEPEGSQLGGGIYCPEPETLKRIRLSIFENYDEFKEILNEPQFASFFGKLYSPEQLKKAPTGFPPDFEGIEYLKLKHFLTGHALSDSFISKEDLMDYAPKVFKTMLPLNRFFNDTINE